MDTVFLTLETLIYKLFQNTSFLFIYYYYFFSKNNNNNC